MKRFLPFLVVALVFLMIGCEGEPEEALQAPSNLQIEVTGTDNLSVKLSWTASPTADIDGYVIKLDDIELDRITGIEYTHTNPTKLGIYRVRAYRDDDESGAINASTELITDDEQGPVWWFNAPGHSAYGWDENGVGSTYSFVVANKEFIDFWMDSVSAVKGTDKIISPDVWWSDADSTLFHTSTNTGETGFTNTKTAPEFGIGAYANYAEITAEGKVYILYLEGGYYVKMLVTGRETTGHHNFTFKYGFQPVAEFRRLGDN